MSKRIRERFTDNLYNAIICRPCAISFCFDDNLNTQTKADKAVGEKHVRQEKSLRMQRLSRRQSWKRKARNNCCLWLLTQLSADSSSEVVFAFPSSPTERWRANGDFDTENGDFSVALSLAWLTFYKSSGFHLPVRRNPVKKRVKLFD